MALENAFVATQATTFTIKETFYNLSLKKHKWNVQLINQDVRERRMNLVIAGHASDETDIILSLFRAFETSSNDKLKMLVKVWKNEWYSGRWTTAEQLMEKGDSKYTELKQLGTWGNRAGRDEQIIALNAKITKMADKKKKSGSNQDDDKKSNVPK